ncbi:MAG: hypothetical protein OEY00_09520 [Gammaproteobacteria bacterium]|nr:hypothetical protein [Gammaproteobacteria bacterium]
MNKRYLLVILFCIFSNSSFATGIKFKFFAFLKGECELVKINGVDYTSTCNKKLAARQTVYQNGFISFGFFNDEFSASFAGTKVQGAGSQLLDMTVSRVTKPKGKKLITLPVKGSCIITGKMKDLKSVNCTANSMDSKQSYQVKFRVSEEPVFIFEMGYEPFDTELNVRSAIRKFDSIYTKSGIDGVQKHLESCYPQAVKMKRLPTMITCLSMDTAGVTMDKVYVKKTNKPHRLYFTEEEYSKRIKNVFGPLVVNQESQKKLDAIIDNTKKGAVHELNVLIKKQTKQHVKPETEETFIE